jgi:hypothetical protein
MPLGEDDAIAGTDTAYVSVEAGLGDLADFGRKAVGIPYLAPVGPIRAAARARTSATRLSAPSARLVQTWAEPSGERRAWRSG